MRIVREAVHPGRRGVAFKAREASAAERAAGAILNANKPMFNREISPWKPIPAPVLCPFRAKMKTQKMYFTKNETEYVNPMRT